MVLKFGFENQEVSLCIQSLPLGSFTSRQIKVRLIKDFDEGLSSDIPTILHVCKSRGTEVNPNSKPCLRFQQEKTHDMAQVDVAIAIQLRQK
eukprot:555380-Amphidinium_carterae.3